MAKWIIVHASWDGKPIWLNAERIWKIEAGAPDKHRPIDGSWIFKSDQSDDYTRVRETPEELMTLIDKAALLAAQVSGDT